MAVFIFKGKFDELNEANEICWTVVDMKNDWGKIYPVWVLPINKIYNSDEMIKFLFKLILDSI
jgi:hypothetical protein